MKTAIPRNNFSSGLISQKLSGRIDLPAFVNGCKVLDNFFINLCGSISKRPGFEYINSLQRTGQETGEERKFIKFVFNQEQVYVLEFYPAGVQGDRTGFKVWLETKENKLELYRDDGGHIVFWTIGLLDFETFKTIKFSQNGDVIYCCCQAIKPFTITRTYSNNVLDFTVASVNIETGTGRENPFDLDGNPTDCCFYQQRLFYVGFSRAINKIWASDVGYYNRFTTNRSARSDILEIDGFNFSMVDCKLSIDWIKETVVGLILGSRQGVSVIKGDSGLLSPFNFSCSLVNQFGSSEQKAIAVGSVLIYIESNGKRLRALQYNWEVNGFISTDLNVYNPEITQDDRIVKICFQEDGRDFVYVLTEKGNLYYLLFSSEEMLFAWGKVKSYKKIKWVETMERFSGGTNLFIWDENFKICRLTDEFFLQPLENFVDKSESVQNLHQLYYDYLLENINNFNYLDFSCKYEMAEKSNVLEGFDRGLYFDGCDFSICGDGYFFENVEIKDGKIQLPKGVEIKNFTLGYNYKAKMKTMNLGGMLGDNNTMIAKKNIFKVYIRLYNSWGGKFGTDYYDLKKLNYQKTEWQRFGEPFTLQEQDIAVYVRDRWEFSKSYWLVAGEAYPFNVNSITILQEVN